MSAHPQAVQARHTPKTKEISKMKENKIKSHTLYSDPVYGQSQPNAVWERIIFSQNYKAKRVSSAQLKLDTDLVLSDAFFNDLLACMKSLQPQDPNIKDDPTKYIPEKFQNIFYNIQPGKHYIEWVSYLAKLNAGEVNANPKYEKFTCTCSFFEESPELDCIATALGRVNTDHSEFKFEHKDEGKGIGLSYNASDNSINLEIKFLDRNTLHESPSFKIGNRREPPHPKKEIILNLHLRNENSVSLCPGKSSIATAEIFSESIQERLNEFFTFFYKAQEWLDESKESLSPPQGKKRTECGFYSNKNGALFYLQPPRGTKKKTPESSPEFVPSEDLSIPEGLDAMKDLSIARLSNEVASGSSFSQPDSMSSLLSSSVSFRSSSPSATTDLTSPPGNGAEVEVLSLKSPSLKKSSGDSKD